MEEEEEEEEGVTSHQRPAGGREGGSEGGEDGEKGSTCKGGVRIGRWGDGRQHLIDDG